MTVLRSLCAYTHDMEPVRAKEECSGARVQAVAWGEPLMPYSVRRRGKWRWFVHNVETPPQDFRDKRSGV